MNIFVGNLLFEATEAQVKRLFEGFGTVASVVIVKDKKGVNSRGFGFVEMPDEKQARAAIASLEAMEFMGRPLNVSPARHQDVAPPPRERKRVKTPLETEVAVQQGLQDEQEQKKKWFAPVFFKPGGYKGGRRSRSYMKRRQASGLEPSVSPQPKRHVNPNAWRKKSEKSVLRPKKPEGVKTWKDKPEGAKPWRKNKKPARFKR